MDEKELITKKLNCVIHYTLPTASPILPLNEHKFQVLLNNKNAREKLGMVEIAIFCTI